MHLCPAASRRRRQTNGKIFTAIIAKEKIFPFVSVLDERGGGLMFPCGGGEFGDKTSPAIGGTALLQMFFLRRRAAGTNGGGAGTKPPQSGG